MIEIKHDMVAEKGQSMFSSGNQRRIHGSAESWRALQG